MDTPHTETTGQAEEHNAHAGPDLRSLHPLISCGELHEISKVSHLLSSMELTLPGEMQPESFRAIGFAGAAWKPNSMKAT